MDSKCRHMSLANHRKGTYGGKQLRGNVRALGSAGARQVNGVFTTTAGRKGQTVDVTRTVAAL